MAAAASGLKGKLTVTVHQARDLKDVQLLGKQDPYVTLMIGNETFKTKVVSNAGTTAEWNQAFLFNLTGVEDAIHIKVNDKETLIDRPIARCDIGLRELCEKAKGATLFQLHDVNNFNQMAGQISLSVEFNGTGLVTSSTVTPPAAVQQTPPMQQIYPQPYPTQPMQPVYPPQQYVPVQATTIPTPAAPYATQQQQHDVHKEKNKKDKKHKDKKGSKKGSKKKKKHERSHSGSSSSSSSSDSD